MKNKLLGDPWNAHVGAVDGEGRRKGSAARRASYTGLAGPRRVVAYVCRQFMTVECRSDTRAQLKRLKMPRRVEEEEWSRIREKRKGKTRKEVLEKSLWTDSDTSCDILAVDRKCPVGLDRTVTTGQSGQGPSGGPGAFTDAYLDRIIAEGAPAEEGAVVVHTHFVAVPPGVGPGEEITVIVAGSRLPIRLPQGATPGSYLEVSISQKLTVPTDATIGDAKTVQGFPDAEHETASRVTEFVRKGTAAFVARQLDHAIELFTSGLQLNAKHAVLYNNRSACYLDKGMLEDALKDAEKCTSIEPTFYKGWLRKGKVLYEMHDLEGSLDAIQRGVWLEPTAPELLNCMAAVVDAINERHNKTRGKSTDKALNPNVPLDARAAPSVRELSPVSHESAHLASGHPMQLLQRQRDLQSGEKVLEKVKPTLQGADGEVYSTQHQHDFGHVHEKGKVLTINSPGCRSPESLTDASHLSQQEVTSKTPMGPKEPNEAESPVETKIVCHTQSLVRNEPRSGDTAGKSKIQEQPRFAEQQATTPEISFIETLFSDQTRNAIPWATSLIGGDIPGNWKEGIQFRFPQNYAELFERDELVVMQRGQKVETNREQKDCVFALVIQVHADSTLTLLVDMFEGVIKKTSANEVSKIHEGLLRWLYTAGNAGTFDGDYDEHVCLLSAQTCREFGNAAYLAMHFESAIHCFTAGLVLNPSDTVLINNRSKALFEVGDFSRSLMDAELCIAIRPNWFRGWLRAALALSKLNLLSAARGCMDQALQFEPSNVELLDAVEIIEEQAGKGLHETGTSSVQAQQGYSGLEVASEPPYYIVNVDNLRDGFSVLQGQEGYDNEEIVMPGDRIVHNVEDVTCEEIQDPLRGDLNSLVEWTLQRASSNWYQVRVIRNIPTTTLARPTNRICSPTIQVRRRAHAHDDSLGATILQVSAAAIVAVRPPQTGAAVPHEVQALAPSSERERGRPHVKGTRTPPTDCAHPSKRLNESGGSHRRTEGVCYSPTEGVSYSPLPTSEERSSPTFHSPQIHPDDELSGVLPPHFGDYHMTSYLLDDAAKAARMKFDQMFDDMPDKAAIGNMCVYSSRTTLYSSDSELGDRQGAVDDFLEDC